MPTAEDSPPVAVCDASLELALDDTERPSFQEDSTSGILAVHVLESAPLQGSCGATLYAESASAPSGGAAGHSDVREVRVCARRNAERSCFERAVAGQVQPSQRECIACLQLVADQRCALMKVNAGREADEAELAWHTGTAQLDRMV
eukprot:420010-Rhodomonas_salina.1